MLDSTYNLLVGEAFILFLTAILLYLWEYRERQATQGFEVWFYKFVIIMMAAVIFLSLAGYAPTKMVCSPVVTRTNSTGTITTYSTSVLCGGETVKPDAGTIWLLFGLGFLSIFLAIIWAIIHYATPR